MVDTPAWHIRFFDGPPPPDRVERLLRDCGNYYRSGDRDIAVLLLREVEKELVTKLGPVFADA
jgi:hypothetical protein